MADSEVQTALRAAFNSRLALAGGTMTGTLTLSADPVEGLEAATKQYVDSQVSAAAGGDAVLYTEQSLTAEQQAQARQNIGAGSDNATIALTGDATGSGSFNGSTELSISTALAASGVAAGNYGQAADQALGFGSAFSIPYFSVDAKGRITVAATRTLTMPAAPSGNLGFPNYSNYYAVYAGVFTPPANGWLRYWHVAGSDYQGVYIYFGTNNSGPLIASFHDNRYPGSGTAMIPVYANASYYIEITDNSYAGVYFHYML